MTDKSHEEASRQEAELRRRIFTYTPLIAAIFALFAWAVPGNWDQVLNTFFANLPLILAGLGGLVVALRKIDENTKITEAKGQEAVVAADEAKAIAKQTNKNVNELDKKVNGRMEEFLQAKFNEGVLAGRKEIEEQLAQKLEAMAAYEERMNNHIKRNAEHVAGLRAQLEEFVSVKMEFPHLTSEEIAQKVVERLAKTSEANKHDAVQIPVTLPPSH